MMSSIAVHTIMSTNKSANPNSHQDQSTQEMFNSASMNNGDEMFHMKSNAILGIHKGRSPNMSNQDHLESLRCRYSNKRCDNLRTAKLTGGLHSFCEMHRQKANNNQRNVLMRKQFRRHLEKTALIDNDDIRKTLRTTKYEPHLQPTPLIPQDVDMLVELFGNKS